MDVFTNYDPNLDYTQFDQTKPPPGMPDLFRWFEPAPEIPQLFEPVEAGEDFSIYFPKEDKRVSLTLTEYAVMYLLHAPLVEPRARENPDLELTYDNMVQVRDEILKTYKQKKTGNHINTPDHEFKEKGINIYLYKLRKKLAAASIESWVIPVLCTGTSLSVRESQLYSSAEINAYKWLDAQELLPEGNSFWYRSPTGTYRAFVNGARVQSSSNGNIKPQQLTILLAYICQLTGGNITYPESTKAFKIRLTRDSLIRMLYSEHGETITGDLSGKFAVVLSQVKKALASAKNRAVAAGRTWDLPDLKLPDTRQLKIKQPRRTWSATEIAAVKTLAEQGLSTAEIAKGMNFYCTNAMIWAVSRRNKIKLKKSSRPRRPAANHHRQSKVQYRPNS